MEKMPQYKISVSSSFYNALGEHIRFMACRSPSAAVKMQADIVNALNSLAVMPERCLFISNEMLPANQYRKLYVKKWYLILFQIREGVVYVDYIIDCRQDNSWLRI